jgi:N utilization substance protein A
VPNDQLSLAIGRQGQNVRLASKLIGWRIDVKSEQRYNNLSDEGYQSLLKLQGVDESLADQLPGKNIFSTAVLAEKTVDDLTVIRAIDEDFAVRLIEEAKTIPFVAKEVPEEDSSEAKNNSSEPVPAGADEAQDALEENVVEGDGAKETEVLNKTQE